MQFFRYILTFWFVCLLFTAHTNAHSVTCSPAVLFSHFELPGTQTAFESLFLSLFALLSLLCCVFLLSISMVATFSSYFGALYFVHHFAKSSFRVFRGVCCVTIVHSSLSKAFSCFVRAQTITQVLITNT